MHRNDTTIERRRETTTIQTCKSTKFTIISIYYLAPSPAYCHFSLDLGSCKKPGGLPKPSACPKLPGCMTPACNNVFAGGGGAGTTSSSPDDKHVQKRARPGVGTAFGSSGTKSDMQEKGFCALCTHWVCTVATVRGSTTGEPSQEAPSQTAHTSPENLSCSHKAFLLGVFLMVTSNRCRLLGPWHHTPSPWDHYPGPWDHMQGHHLGSRMARLPKDSKRCDGVIAKTE